MIKLNQCILIGLFFFAAEDLFALPLMNSQPSTNLTKITKSCSNQGLACSKMEPKQNKNKSKQTTNKTAEETETEDPEILKAKEETETETETTPKQKPNPVPVPKDDNYVYRVAKKQLLADHAIGNIEIAIEFYGKRIATPIILMVVGTLGLGGGLGLTGAAFASNNSGVLMGIPPLGFLMVLTYSIGIPMWAHFGPKLGKLIRQKEYVKSKFRPYGPIESVSFLFSGVTPIFFGNGGSLLFSFRF